jgi:phytoene synthase
MTDAIPASLIDTSHLTIKKGSKSFAAAARFFNAQMREDAYLLYAWCRHCDDVIDNQDLGFNGKPQTAEVTQDALGTLRTQTQRAIDNQPCDDPVFEGLRYVLKRNEIPSRYPLELLEGFAMDAANHEYRTLEDTLQYCYYVAGVVGIIMAYVMGAREPSALQRAADLGIAFQLTNISRDVIEDAGIGRIYIPGDWLAEAGIPPGEITDSRHSQALYQVLLRLLDEADRFYASADEGLRALGFRSACAVASARAIYRAIGNIVRKRGESAMQARVIVGRPRKVLGVAEGLMGATRASLIDRFTRPAPRDANLWRC